MKLSAKEICIFGLLGALMYAAKALMAVVPNVHFVGVFVVAITCVYRKKALYSIYIFVLIVGLLDGFGTWWLPYLYIWLPLWLGAMFLPQNTKKKVNMLPGMLVCSLHGFLFGVLYAPAQALLFGLDFEGMVAWIIAGLPFDIAHGIGNFFGGILIYPIISILKQAEKKGKIQ